MTFIGNDFANSAMLKRFGFAGKVKQVLIFNAKLLFAFAVILPAAIFGILALWGANGLLVT